MYVKLFGSILNSSIWMEDAATKVVWITMLVKADETGFVQGVESALARDAGVSREECRAALDILSSPDPDSQTPDHEGRRIESAQGGWMVLNYAKYREIRTREQVKEARRKARQREKAKAKDADDDGPVAGQVGHVPSVPPIASASASVSASGSLEMEVSQKMTEAGAEALRGYLRNLGDGPLAVMRQESQTFDWATLSQALVEMRGAGAKFSANALRGFARKLTGTRPSLPAPPPDPACDCPAGFADGSRRLTILHTPECPNA